MAPRHNSLIECLNFVYSAPELYMPNYLSKLDYVLSYLRERGAKGLSIFLAKNNDSSNEDLARETLLHLGASTREGIDITKTFL